MRMPFFLGVLYGFFLVFVIYFITWIAVRGAVKGAAVPFFLTIGKYLIYAILIRLGFKFLPHEAILGGFTGGIYLSLPALYWINKKYF